MRQSGQRQTRRAGAINYLEARSTGTRVCVQIRPTAAAWAQASVYTASRQHFAVEGANERRARQTRETERERAHSAFGSLSLNAQDDDDDVDGSGAN